MAVSPGADLALLLLGSFHAMVDEVTVELEARGHPGVRPVHEFALRAVHQGADTASDLGRRLSVSKQAAAKTIAALEQLGYVDREADPSDARRKRLRVTPHGEDQGHQQREQRVDLAGGHRHQGCEDQPRGHVDHRGRNNYRTGRGGVRDGLTRRSLAAMSGLVTPGRDAPGRPR